MLYARGIWWIGYKQDGSIESDGLHLSIIYENARAQTKSSFLSINSIDVLSLQHIFLKRWTFSMFLQQV
jgi:hypothetical protein